MQGKALMDDIEGILVVISMTVGDSEECAARRACDILIAAERMTAPTGSQIGSTFMGLFLT